MIEQCIATKIDIFCWGILVGVICTHGGIWLSKFLELWLGNNQKRLDIALGNDLIKMHAKLEENRNKDRGTKL